MPSEQAERAAREIHVASCPLRHGEPQYGTENTMWREGEHEWNGGTCDLIVEGITRRIDRAIVSATGDATRRIAELEYLLEEIRNADPTVEDMKAWKEVILGE